MSVNRTGNTWECVCDKCGKSQAWGTTTTAYPDDEIRKELHALGWEDRSSMSGGRVRWSWYCIACRPAPGDPSAPGRSAGAS